MDRVDRGSQDQVDDVGADSFPASDPPSWTPLQARPPTKSEAKPAEAYLDAARQAQDLQGARVVVGLLLAVFMLGLLIYLAIFA